MEIKKNEIIEQITLLFDYTTGKYFINDKEVSEDEWIRAKCLWENERAYNHLPRFIKKHGFMDCDIDRSNDNIIKMTFTNYKQ